MCNLFRRNVLCFGSVWKIYGNCLRILFDFWDDLWVMLLGKLIFFWSVFLYVKIGVKVEIDSGLIKLI